MDRRTRTLVVVGTAVISATVASASVYRAVTRIPVREVEVAHTYVVVSSRPLALGARVTATDVKRVGWPQDAPLSGSFTRAEDVIGRGLVVALAENEPITESKLAPREAGAGLSPAIPAGMRAISVKVNEVIGVAGFAVPGARVDVVATMRTQGGAVSRVLVANVPVLAAGTRFEQEQRREEKPIPATVVTLMVTPAQAEKIALASAEGNITLMLRNPLDLTEPETPGAELNRATGGATAVPPQPVATAGAVRATRPAPAAAAAPPPTAARYTVEVFRAGKFTQETVQ